MILCRCSGTLEEWGHSWASPARGHTLRGFRFWFAVLGAIGSMLFLSPRPALACTLPAPPEDGVYPTYTVAERISGADIILVGTILEVETEGGFQTALVDVEQYLRGSGSTKVAIGNFGWSALCLTQVQAGMYAIFFATGDPITGLKAYYFPPPYRAQLSAVEEVSPQRLAEIMAVLEQEVVTQTSTTEPTDTQAPPATVTETATAEPSSTRGDLQTVPAAVEGIENRAAGPPSVIGLLAGSLLLLLLGGLAIFLVLRMKV